MIIDNPQTYREFCLSLGEVTEKMPFGNFAPRFASILALYTQGHMFTYADVDDFKSVYLKADPMEIEHLYAVYDCVGEPLNMSKKYWVRIDLGSDMPQEVLCDLLRKAYDIVFKKYSKKK